MSEIVYPEHMKEMMQIRRCISALKAVDVPDSELAKIEKLSSPLIFQLAHLVIFKEMPYRDALRWIKDHRDEIMAYSKGIIDEQGKPKSKTN
jgi:hypothetical protein